MENEKFELSKTKLTLFILLIVMVVVASISFYQFRNQYNLTLTKNNMKIEYLKEDYVNSKAMSVVEVPEARNVLTGGPFNFGENILLSSGTIVNVENRGYIDDITNGRVMVDFLGQEYVDYTKYIALYVKVYNNTNINHNLKGEDFEVGYVKDGKEYFTKSTFNNEVISRMKGIFSLNTILPYTIREGYVFIPVDDAKLNNFYFKLNIDGIPLVFRN